jgi:putative ATP-binding cassette transporter
LLIQELLVVEWRDWFTRSLLGDYFAHNAYYSIHQGFGFDGTVGAGSDSAAKGGKAGDLDNPDQRIAEDVKAFTQQSVRFLLLLVQQIFTVLGFASILFSIAPVLVIFLVLYAVAGTYISVNIFGAKLVPANAEVMKVEGDFRFALVRLGENSESVAFYNGGKQELDVMESRFQKVIDSVLDLVIWQRHLSMFKNGYHYLTYVIPPLIVAPRYFSGELDFGVVAQTAMAFRMVLSALTLIVQQFQDLTRFSAGIDRLYHLVSYLEQHRALKEMPESHPKNVVVNNQSRIVRKKDPNLQQLLKFENVIVTTPSSVSVKALTKGDVTEVDDGQGPKSRVLIRNLNLDLNPNGNLLIVGASGCGKSSLLRVMSGLWSFGTGKISSKFGISEWQMHCLFLPQRPYLILGTLRDQLLYPVKEDENEASLLVQTSDAQLIRVLKDVGLENLVDRVGGFNVERDWDDMLSSGEKQRIAFARVLVHKPQLVFLDEATSALDVLNEQRVYSVLSEHKISYVSVGHRESVLRYHDNVLVLDQQGAGSWQIMSIQDYKEYMRKKINDELENNFN